MRLHALQYFTQRCRHQSSYQHYDHLNYHPRERENI